MKDNTINVHVFSSKLKEENCSDVLHVCVQGNKYRQTYTDKKKQEECPRLFVETPSINYIIIYVKKLGFLSFSVS